MKFSFFFIALVLFLAVTQRAFAYDTSLFMVEGVKVDVTADNAVSAQEQAFEQAQIQAFNILADRMVTETDVSNMTVPGANTIASMIKDYEVSNEQISAVRYVGEYTFCFDPKSLGNYFSISGVQYIDTKSKPLLILPVFQINGKTTIWGTENIWLKTWALTQFPASLVPVEVPIGDLDDVTDINDDNALRFERKNLDRMLLRYSAREAAIMIAVPDEELGELTPDQPSAGTLRVSIYRTDRGSAEYVNEFVLSAEDDQTVIQLYNDAVMKGFRALQKNWKNRTAASISQSQYYYVRTPIDDLEELIDIQNILRTLPGMNKITVVSVKPTEARLLMTFRGDETRLREALRSGSYYLLSRAYNKDEEAITSSSPYVMGLQVMYDLYRQNKTIKKNHRSPQYSPPVQRQNRSYTPPPEPATRSGRVMQSPSPAKAIQRASGEIPENNYTF